MRRYLCGLAAILAAVMGVGGQTATPSSSAPSPAPCGGLCRAERVLRCQHRLRQAMGRTQALQSAAGRGPAGDAKGCEGLPRSGQAHGLRQAASRIVAWDRMELADASKVCLKCHQDKKITADVWVQDAAQRGADLARIATRFHKPGKRRGDAARRGGPGLLACHDGLARRSRPGAHILGKGDDALTCNLCHSVHGTAENHQLRKAQEQLCRTCHEKTPKARHARQPNGKVKAQGRGQGPRGPVLQVPRPAGSLQHLPCGQDSAPRELPRKHEAQARKTPQACLNCHETQVLPMCHEKMPKGFGPPAAPAPPAAA